MPEDPMISIIIRCCNEERHIGRLLSGIMAQNRADYEIILVDSGSTDATLKIAERFPVRIVRIMPEQFSFGYALNQGCEAARGEFLVFASAHVYPVCRDWLSGLVAPFAEGAVAVVYGRQMGDERSRFSEQCIFSQWFPEESCTDQSHAFCNNANLAIRAARWREERYDEKLTGLEDLDWAKRMMARRQKIVYVASAVVVHVHEERYCQIYRRYYREAVAMKRIYPDERFSFSAFLRAVWMNVWFDVVSAVQHGHFWRYVVGIVRFRVMQFWGTFRGHRQVGSMSTEMRNRFYYPTGRRSDVAERPLGQDLIEYT